VETLLAFTVLVALVAAERVVELVVSVRNAVCSSVPWSKPGCAVPTCRPDWPGR
jgi:hypothetical protein